MHYKNILSDKAYAFAIDIVLFANELQRENEFILSRQLLKAGTSIGANIQESIGAQSKRDFIAKLQISLKEAIETKYWICLLRDTGKIQRESALDLLTKCSELIRMITSSLKTAKRNLKQIDKNYKGE